MSLSKAHLLPQKVLVIPRKRWIRPNMTEKLFTGTLRINQPTNQPLPKQLYVLISSFKYVHNMRTFVCDYHQSDPTTFLHHQIQICSAHARILALGYKMHFPCFPCTGSRFFNTVHKELRALSRVFDLLHSKNFTAFSLECFIR